MDSRVLLIAVAFVAVALGAGAFAMQSDLSGDSDDASTATDAEQYDGDTTAATSDGVSAELEAARNETPGNYTPAEWIREQQQRIDNRDQEIAALRDNISTLEGQVAELEQRKATLNEYVEQNQTDRKQWLETSYVKSYEQALEYIRYANFSWDKAMDHRADGDYTKAAVDFETATRQYHQATGVVDGVINSSIARGDNFWTTLTLTSQWTDAKGRMAQAWSNQLYAGRNTDDPTFGDVLEDRIEQGRILSLQQYRDRMNNAVGGVSG